MSMARQRIEAAWAAMAALALALLIGAVLAAAGVPSAAWADDEPTEENDEPVEKVDEPVITHLVQEDSTGEYDDIADWSQGVQIPYRVTGTMALWLEDVSPYEYWFVIEPDPGMKCIAESARFTLVHADGTQRDVTDSLDALEVDGKLIAGSANLRAAIRDLLPTDTLVLDYACMLTSSCKLGFGEGNAVYAHVEYTGRPATWPMPARAKAALTMRTQAADPRPTGLSSTPEIKTTVYSYGIEAVKLADDTQGPLARAGFVLRDAEGLFYVRDAAWSSDAEQATVVRTAADGKVAFPGLDAGAYVLEETYAPRGYDKADPIDVTIESDIVDGQPSIKASSRATAIAAVNSASGTVGFTIVDKANGEPKDTDDPDDPNNPNNPNNSGGVSGGQGTNGGGSGAESDAKDDRVRPANGNGLIDAFLAATGDPIVLTGLALLALGAVGFVVMAAREHRKRGRP